MSQAKVASGSTGVMTLSCESVAGSQLAYGTLLLHGG